MGKIRNVAISLSKKNVFLRKIIRGLYNCLRKIQYKLLTLGIKIDDKTIIFACFNGKSYSCSPKAIYKYMSSQKKYEGYTYIWAFRHPEEYNELENNKNTILVQIHSKQYKKYLAKAKYWIFNYKIPDYIYPKKNQVFIQCWHGTPLKRLGCDLEHFDNVLNTMKGIKKRYKIEASKFSYFISPSKFASEKFISAWNLKEIGKENIIVEEGYPRNDFLLNYTKQEEENIKKKLGIENDNRKIILYAPTYRSDQHQTGVGYTYKEELNFAKLQEEIGNKYIILFRPHYFIANIFDFEKYKGFVYNVSDIDDINELYIISDILITDYSSVFFDFANLKRPIIFYIYDLEHYRDKSNGFYIDLNELPGKIVKTQQEVENEILRLEKEFKYDNKYKEFNDKYNYLDDGNASKRVVEECIK
jgi:CDP-glycerol glycerophosphotransferase